VQSKRSLWFWRILWASTFLVALGFYLLYAWLPADGGLGDMESFRPEGFDVQWLFEEREGGLQVGDVIVRGGGHTIDEWLDGAPRGPEWQTGGIVTYEILRDERAMTLDIQLAPVPFSAILGRWWSQLLVAAALFVIGTFVFWKRPQELSARLLMFFCAVIALQYWGDAYNFQYATLPWRWPFYIQLAYELLIYGLGLAAISHFVLVFPVTHPLIERFPRLTPFVVYALHPLVVVPAMLLAPDWSTAMAVGSNASWILALLYIGLSVGVGIRSVRVADDPVTRAQVRWILLCAGVGCAIMIPGYALPLMLTNRPLIPHPVGMLLIALIPLAFAVAVLRFRLFRIDVIINRTLVYATLTALLAGLYLLIVRVLTLLVEVVWQGENSNLAIFVATLTIAMLFEPLRRRVQNLIDLTFYRNKLDYQRLLPEMSERLATSILLDELALLLTDELPQRLQIEWATLSVLDREDAHFVPTGGSEIHPALPTDHALAEYLFDSGRSVLRLEPPADLPGDVQAFLGEFGIELCIPLIVRETLVGLYSLGAKQSAHTYSPDETQLLDLLGRQAAVSVENSRLFQATERQAEELVGLHQAAVAISSSLEVEEVLRALALQLGRVLSVSAVYICDFDDKSFQSTVLAEWIDSAFTAHDSELGITYDLRQYPTTFASLLAKQPLLIQAKEPDLDPANRASAEQKGWHSTLLVPLVLQDRVIGFAELWETRQERRFTTAEVRLCQTMATDAAAAIDHARLFEAEREQRQLTQALQEAADVVSQTLDLDQVLDRILEQVEQVVEGDTFNIMLVKGDFARVVRSRGYDQLGVEEEIASLYMSISQYPTLVQMVETGKPIVVPDTANDPNWIPVQGWEWLRSYVSAPIRVAGQTIGFLNVDRTRPAQFGPADAELLAAFAHHAATALENARLYEQAQQEISERKRAEETTKASLAEKEVLLKEIHHRVKNNLQVISSLLYLQSKRIGDPETLDMFQDSQHRVRSMALVHERLYQTEDLAQVNAAEYIQTLASYLFRSYQVRTGQIRLEVNVGDVALGIDTAVPCGLLINELVSNSLKHAFPNGREGMIFVDLNLTSDGNYLLAVSDDGVGLPDDSDPADNKSLGLQLVNALVGQLEGTIDLDTSKGTRFEILFPAPK